MKQWKQWVRGLLQRRGYDIIRYTGDPLSDLSAAQKEILSRVKPFTMTSPERLASLISAVDHVVSTKLPGDIAECGVWRGGSMMAVALALLARGDTTRTLYLYDTFEGMSAPTAVDKSPDGRLAQDYLAEALRGEGQWGNGVWCYASLEDVRANVLSTGYPADKVRFLKGKVEDTIPATLPSPMALLRLDTDWYESTRHELKHLFPLLGKGGILIIDDYGAWDGARKAVDEYFSGFNQRIYLHRIDNTGRLLVKD